MRIIFSLLSGAVFGLGLLISGMTDTLKVQGWLDLFGHWDPTLAFVLIGGIVPMFVAWRMTRTRTTAILGSRIPAPHDPILDRRLIVGSGLFGVGWAMSGLCPGPAMASLSYGGTGGAVFMLAMLAGMVFQPRIKFGLSPAPSIVEADA